MKPLSQNPPSRFPPRPIAEAPYRWWVAKVKPRQEKAFAFDLMKQGIEYYLPLYLKVTRRADNNKPRKCLLPLFPGYVCFSLPVPQHIFSGGRVVNIIEIRNQTRFIHQLTQIYLALEAGAKLEPLLEKFEPGMAVRVRSGPLRGVEGVIAQVRDSQRLVLEVDPFGRAMVTIDSALVEPI